MAKNLLPALSEKRAVYNYFPTDFQTFIFRNWESVKTETMAKVLGTDVMTVEQLASDMGLRVPAKYNKDYETRGYLTIIRNNWHLLPYSQLLELLGWNEDELVFTLREDDFFGVKLGQVKPDVPRLQYRPLTDDEKARTADIRKHLLEKLPDFGKETKAEDFDFIDKFGTEEKQNFDGKEKCVVLDKSWGLCDETSGKYTGVFTDFVLENAHLSLDGNEKYITLRIQPDDTKKAESHKVSITKDGIDVFAVDEAGILRALQLLVKLIKQANSFSFDEAEIVRDTRFDIRYIHSYCALFGDPFMDGGISSYPDSLLKEYSDIGINGIWLHSVLYKMCEFPWEKELSDGCQKRLEGLKKLCDRAEKHGIKVYLYLNEPRTRPKAFFDKYPHLLGYLDEAGEGTLCTSKKEVQQYLYDGVRTICKAVPNLGGFFTITASENKTNCLSHSIKNFTYCPICKNRPQEEVYAEVIGIIKKACMSVNEKIEVIAFDWSWHWCNDRLDTVRRTAKTGARILCVSEEGVSKNFDGTTSSVVDYSISRVGPGEIAKKTWQVCREVGAKSLAKVQFNNSWEGSTIPYIPALDLIKEHVEGICKEGVDGLMLSWSLGGYPSMNLKAAAKYFYYGEDCDSIYDEMFGKDAEVVRQTASKISEAFLEYPFYHRTAYLGPHHMGPANILFEKSSGLKATMTGYPYDDTEGWRSIFPIETYEKQMRLLCEKWKTGLDYMCENITVDNVDAEEFAEIVKAGYCLFRSSYLQIRYNRLRDEFNNGKKDLRDEILSVLDEEMTLARELYAVASKNSTIGYEAANHYFFNKYSLAEKIVNVAYLTEKFRIG